MGKIREKGRKITTGSLREPAAASAVMLTHTEFRTGAESVKILRNFLLCKDSVLQTARVECLLKRAAGGAAKHALRAYRLLRKLGNHCMISVKIRRKSLVYIGLLLQMPAEEFCRGGRVIAARRFTIL